jgi:serine/threonine-protein kinase
MDLREQLQKTLGDAYTLERELGGGGMSRVFVATEAALGRRVVVKVLPGHSAGSVSIDRFKREIQLAARLQHPHIVPLLTAGESEGLPYFTMPFVEGESLRVRLAKGGELPVAEGMRILREVAAALANAHEKGIVHRDIKPDNVLLSGGAAMVTDFGVAKALSASSNAEGNAATSLGVALGTPAYMAPEQAAASPNIDARADIYAWGIMAYELFAGRPPFSGRSPQAVLAAQVSEAPEHVLKLRPALPAALAALIMRCLEKHAADRPQSAGELIHTLDAITTPSGGSEPTSAQRSISYGGTAPVTAGSSKVRIGVAVAVVLFVAGGIWAVSRMRPSATAAAVGQKTLAVLPLANTDTATEYLSLGIGDDIRARLTSSVKGLKVTSASTSNSYRGKTVEPRAVGQALNVAFVVLGEMRRAKDKLHVTTELVNTADGSAVWNGSFDIVEKDLAGLPDSIAHAISGTLLTSQGGGDDIRHTAGADTRNEKAYDLYLRGRFLLERRGNETLHRAVGLFQQAIALDSTFARGYAGLAQALMVLPDYSDTPADSVYGLSLRAANRAIALAPTLAEAYAARGTVGYLTGKWADGIRDLRNATNLDPQYGMAFKWLGQALAYSGHLDEAKSFLVRATELDPLLAVPWLNYGEYLFIIHRDSAAIAAYRRALQIDPSFSMSAYDIMRVLAASGRTQEAVAELTKFDEAGSTAWQLGVRAYVLAKVGRVPEARAIARRLDAQVAANSGAAIGAAQAHLGLGDIDTTVDRMIRAAIRGAMGYFSTPDYDPVRTHPRYPELLLAAHLDDQPIAQWKGRAPAVKP